MCALLGHIVGSVREEEYDVHVLLCGVARHQVTVYQAPPPQTLVRLTHQHLLTLIYQGLVQHNIHCFCSKFLVNEIILNTICYYSGPPLERPLSRETTPQ